MNLFELLNVLNPEFKPGNTKIHLASWNGEDDPLDVYLSGQFDEWQKWQTKRNFERQYVVSLISLPKVDHWLFAGVHISGGCERDQKQQCYFYKLHEDKIYTELNGRLVVKFTRSGRQPYLLAENWVEKIILSEIYPERLTIGVFPGYRAVNLARNELELIFSQSLESWRTALSNVAGVYLISDEESGQLYVGAACGTGGIWQRWSDYVKTGHGGNVELMRLLKEKGRNHMQSFRYAILEVADVHTSDDDVYARERHWKNILLTRSHGLNMN